MVYFSFVCTASPLPSACSCLLPSLFTVVASTDDFVGSRSSSAILQRICDTVSSGSMANRKRPYRAPKAAKPASQIKKIAVNLNGWAVEDGMKNRGIHQLITARAPIQASYNSVISNNVGQRHIFRQTKGFTRPNSFLLQIATASILLWDTRLAPSLMMSTARRTKPMGNIAARPWELPHLQMLFLGTKTPYSSSLSLNSTSSQMKESSFGLCSGKWMGFALRSLSGMTASSFVGNTAPLLKLEGDKSCLDRECCKDCRDNRQEG